MKSVFAFLLVLIAVVVVSAGVNVLCVKDYAKKADLALTNKILSDNLKRIDVNFVVLKKTIEDRTGGVEIPMNGKTQTVKK